MTRIARTPLASFPQAPTAEPPWTARSRGLILDLDGTLIRGHEVIPGASELLTRWAGRCVIVSNNSTDTAADLAPRLRAMGLPVQAGMLVLAGEQAVRHIARQNPQAAVLLCASDALRSFAAGLGLALVDRDADIVLLARDLSFGYGTLQTLAGELARGAALMVSNGDLTHPGPQGAIVPETGALLQSVLACAPGARPHILGKPGAMLLEEGLRRLGLAPADVTVIGDNVRTDGLGAVRLGIGYLLVGNAPCADAPDVARLLDSACPRRHALPAGIEDDQ
ncbi:haloacid dehalogenase [Achromobacter xylosoxidans]|uniref:HAD-IIA family hydrolase n=1 Tax=Achromobacter aegrifaciens TaxID=1287736 RepID=UPI000D43427C|nr:HAD family hydrolase [Achromobacter aegrifaciens]MDQ1758587.1 HAD hydrolase-like protein [Achromobacter aegrifaciens]PTN49894.1 haloacid dehalogenase [Achromobacter xylosoxidans]